MRENNRGMRSREHFLHVVVQLGVIGPPTLPVGAGFAEHFQSDHRQAQKHCGSQNDVRQSEPEWVMP